MSVAMFKSAVAAFFMLVVVALLGFTYLMFVRHPDLDRQVVSKALGDKVRVVRDDWGVPHIYAETETDAYYALGYVMAQDRLFQMEAVRRLANGELAELLGPMLVPIDKIVRAFRLRANAEETLANAESFPPTLRLAVDAYIAGVNHCMETEPLPIEFTMLQIPVRPFTAADCLAVAAILPITFADGLREDPLVSMVQAKCPDLDMGLLFPGLSRQQAPVTVMETLDEAEEYLKLRAQNPAASPQSRREANDALDGLKPLLAALGSLTDIFGTAFGSNSWVLAPSRTESGKAILANDPHIAFTNPSVWYEAHMKCGGYELYGYHLPLIPFPLLGHNRQHAWAFTMFANDDVDVYREQFDPADPNKVMYKGEWVDVRNEVETIKVRFAADEKVTIRITPHGPVITDLFRLLDKYEGPEISMFWIWQHVPYTDVEAIYRMGHATDIESFRQACSLVTSPGLNISYADADGNIAWWASGLIPIRPDHVDPKVVLDGASGNDEILGYVPFDDNPHLVNPPWGYIVTANNKSTVKPVGAVQDLPGYWQAGERAGRIEELLDTREKWNIEELKAIQFDDFLRSAPDVVTCLVEVLRGPSAVFQDTDRNAFDSLAAWDFQHNVESSGACIYNVFCDTLLEHIIADEMGPDLFKVYAMVSDSGNFFKAIIHEPESPLWNDITTEPKETREDIVVAAFRDTVRKLTGFMGPDVAQWAWGRIHTMEFKHPFGYLPFFGDLFNIGPFPSSGASDVVNNMTYLGSGPPYNVLGGPSTRRLIDFGDIEHTLTILPTGNSGLFTSPHYDDQAEMFITGKYREPRFTDEQVEANKEHEMTFSPGV